MSDEKFILVNRRKRHKKFGPIIKEQLSLKEFSEIEIDKDIVGRKLFDAVLKFSNSEFEKYVFHNISNVLKILNTNKIFETICYGLGRFSQYKTSMYQLAFLISLRGRYKCQISVYDPAFHPKEIEILKEFKFNVIENNEECKRTITNNITFIYMPHCPRQLINNFLYSNWNINLCNCILLTNSFSDIVEQNINQHMATFANYVLRIYPYITEIKLQNDFEHTEVFCATSIHIFTQQKLNEISRDFWSDKKDPHYPKEYIEFITADETNRQC